MIIDSELKTLLKDIDAKRIIYVNSKKEIYSLLGKNSYDCFYSALPYRYSDYSSSTCFIMVIHGIRPIELPWDYYRYHYFNSLFLRIIAYIVSKLSIVINIIKKIRIHQFYKLITIKNIKIITVSEHSKFSLLNFFPKLDRDIVKMVYSPILMRDNDNLKQEGRKDYYLLIGANRFEKNVYRAIMAFNNLFKANHLENKKILILGASKLPFLNKIKNSSRFEIFGYVSQDDLENYFYNAYAFVYPSLNEGFGYPPLLAMHYGIPVIASSATAIPEVCDNAAIYFDPRSLDDLSNRILQINYNKDLYNALITRGYERVREIKEKQEFNIPTMIQEIFE
jgi:glycosyltransferase involved in cell wall biosynthesis